MTTHHEPIPAEKAKRIGMTQLETAEHRRRIAEIIWLSAQAKAGIAEIEASLGDPAITPREIAAKKLEIATIAYNMAVLQNERAILKIELSEDKALFPR